MIKNDLYIEEIDSFEGFLRLEKIWNKLLFVSQMNEPYLTYEWQLSWFKNFGQGSKLFILLVKAGGEVYGIAPLIISKAFGFRTIKFIGSGWSDYLNFILKRQEQEICDAIFEYIAQVKRKWDFIFLSDVLHYPNKENMFSSSVKKNRLKMEARKYYACLYIPITGDFNSFLKSKSKGFREYIRNDGKAKRKLQKEGDVEMVAIHHPSHHPGIIKILCDIENRSWKKEEKTNHFRSQAILSFFDDIINVFMKNKWIKIWLMMIDQNPIAYLISFYYNKKIVSRENLSRIDLFRSEQGTQEKQKLLQYAKKITFSEELIDINFEEWYRENIGEDLLPFWNRILISIGVRNIKSINAYFGLILINIFFGKNYLLRSGLQKLVDKLSNQIVSSGGEILTGAECKTIKKIDDGYFEWDTPVIEIMPDFELSDPEATQQVTFRHLLSMRAGISEDAEDEIDPDGSFEDLLDATAESEILDLPGKVFEYSNLSASLAGYLGALAVDETTEDLHTAYAKLLKERILI